MRFTQGVAAVAVIFGALSAPAFAQTELRLAHASSEDSLIQQAVNRFKDEVEANTSGSVTIRIYPNAQLGDEGPIAEGVGAGSIDIGLGGVVDPIDPKLSVVTLPFLFEDFESVHRVLDGPVGEQLLSMGEDRGYHMLGFLDSGFRNFSNSQRPVETPDDIVGLKLRTPPNPVILATIEALGALPQSIPFGEVYTALQSNVVDGAEPELRDFVDQQWHEVQEYLSISNYIWTPNYWFMNKAKYDALSDAERQAIDNAVSMTTTWYRSQLNTVYDQIISDVKNKGVQVNVVDTKPFQEKVGSVYERFSSEFGAELVQAVRDAAH